MNRKVVFGIYVVLMYLGSVVQSQAQNPVGQDTTNRVITTAVGFLSISPDARAAAMGDAGGAISPDANSVHWNAGKLAFVENNIGFSLNYTPWLGKIVDDMSLSYLSGYYKLSDDQAVALEMRYFDLGDIDLYGNGPDQYLQSVRPREWAIGGTYSRKLTEKLGIGVSLRYIQSNINQNIASLGDDVKPGKSVAGDIAVYYITDLQMGASTSKIAFAGSISNIGGKISYVNDETKDFLPTNLRLGTAWTANFDAYNTITLSLDFNKLMVPSPPIYATDENGIIYDQNGDPVIAKGKDPDRGVISGMFGSFADAPDGFSEEMQEIMIAFGAEYWYNELFAARAGYFYENEHKGNRKYFTIGVGFRYQVFGLDFAYLIPTQQEHPLAETLRFSLLFNFEN